MEADAAVFFSGLEWGGEDKAQECCRGALDELTLVLAVAVTLKNRINIGPDELVEAPPEHPCSRQGKENDIHGRRRQNDREVHQEAASYDAK